MPTRRFAILEHTTPDGVHHDLLIDRPDEADPIEGGRDPDAKTLWAARIGPPPTDWLTLGRLTLTPLPPHRRRYLDYEGPIAGERGSVRQVAAGEARILAWHDHQKRLRFVLGGPPLTLTITPDDDVLLATADSRA